MAATSSARLLAKITRSISASTAGFLMPTTFSDPFWSAAAEPQKPRCSLPGDSDSPQLWMMMSKSRLRIRSSYCGSSTARIETSMPRRSSPGL